MMMYKAYSGLLLCSDASSMSEMVWELRSRASLTSRNQFCTLASSYHEVQACEMRVYQAGDQFHLHREVVHLVDSPPLQSIPLALGLVIHQFHFNSRWSGVD